MHSYRPLRVAKDDNFHVLEIPLTGGSTMVIFVPRPGTTFRHRITKLNYDRINRLFEMLTAHNIHYRVPKFEIQSSYGYGKDRMTHWFNFKWAGHYSRHTGAWEKLLVRSETDVSKYYTSNALVEFYRILTL
ncbi:unnamed protein product [Caenorhabditis nigoni]